VPNYDQDLLKREVFFYAHFLPDMFAQSVGS